MKASINICKFKNMIKCSYYASPKTEERNSLLITNFTKAPQIIAIKFSVALPILAVNFTTILAPLIHVISFIFLY